MKRGDVARYTQERLGELSAMILKQANVCGVFFRQVEYTAISFMEKNCNAHGARLVEEVLPIVALVGDSRRRLPGIASGCKRRVHRG